MASKAKTVAAITPAEKRALSAFRSLVKSGAKVTYPAAPVIVNPGRKPASKTRAVKLVATNPKSPYVLGKKKETKFPPWRVEEKTASSSVWMMRAAFKTQDLAEQYAKAVHKAEPSMAVRVVKQ